MRKPWVLVLCAVALVATASACGSRLSTEEVVAQGALAGTGGRESTFAPGDDGEVAFDEEGNPVNPDGTPGTPGGSSPNGSSGDPNNPNNPNNPNTPGQPPKATGKPIVIGLVGWFSGSGGETMGMVREVWQAWAKQVNAKGGINGHPVQLLVGDHGGQEDRARSVAQDFVENKGAIALTHGSGGPAVGEYAKQKGIPVVGSILTGSTWNSNPMQFPGFGSNEASSWGGARAMKRNGLLKVASLYCNDSPDCADGNARLKKYAGPEGVEIVFEGEYTVFQPDFTRECLDMQRSGATAVYPLGDVNSMERMARDCARQNFKPAWVTPVMDDGLAANPAFEGAVLTSNAFPWFVRSGSPALEEYGQALAKYAPSRVKDGNAFMSWAWVSAKLFEKAAQNVSDTPTSQDILNALWAMKGETLGGLTIPRTFTRNQPTPEMWCYYEGKIQGGKWVAPQGATPICR